MSSQIPSNAPPGTDTKRITLNSLADPGSVYFTEKSKSPPGNHHTNTYNLVALMMYLIGVEYRHFETRDPPLTENFNRHNQNKNARIIRNLCMIRTALEQGYSQIRSAFLYELKNLSSLPDLIPTEAVTGLLADGIDLQSTKPDINNYLIEITMPTAMLSAQIGMKECRQSRAFFVCVYGKRCNQADIYYTGAGVIKQKISG